MIPMTWQHDLINAHLTLIQWHFKVFAVGSQAVTMLVGLTFII